MRNGPLRGTVRYAGGIGGAEGDGTPCGAVPVPFAGKGKGVCRGGEVVVEGEEVEEVVVRAAGKAVNFATLGIEAHGGVPVKVGRVQTAEPLAGIDAPAVLYYMKSPSSRRFRNLPAVRRHDHLFAPIESLASLDFGENRITNTDLSKPADPALKKVIVDPGYEFELVTTLFKNRPDVSILTE